MRKLLIISLLFISCNSYKAKISKVIDGDSYYLSNGKEVRLYGADSPEATRGHIQPFGIEATNYTRQLIEGKTVKLIKEDRDKYGREVDKVILADGSDLSLLLIKAGLAWTYRKYSPNEYLNAEREAKNKRIGLWIQDNPMPPYKFRKLFKK